MIEIFYYLNYFIFELFGFLFSIGISFLIFKNKFSELSMLEKILILITISLIFSSTLSMLITFLKYNYSEVYTISAILLGLTINLILFFTKNSEYKTNIRSLFSIADKIINTKILFTLCIILPILIISIRPINETDSLFQFNAILDWANNSSGPYDFPNHYVSFWQLSFLPSIVISKSDMLLWIVSLKSILVIYVATIILGKKMGFPSTLNAAVALSGVLFFQFWFPNPSGIATLKEDMIFGAGFILMSFLFMDFKERKSNVVNYVFFIFGIIFVSTKYTGIFIVILACILLLIIKRSDVKKFSNIKSSIFGILLVVPTVGHFYIKNMVLFQNPFYPIKLSLGDIGFVNGNIDLSGTSILSSVGKPALWEIFFSERGIMGGVLFPILFILGFGGFLVLIVLGHRINAFLFFKDHWAPLLFLSGGWLIYFASGWSASNVPGDFFYINYLQSTRYAIGIIVLSELVLLAAIYKITKSHILILIISAFSIASKLFVLLYHFSSEFNDFHYSIIILCLIVYLSLLFVKKIRKNTKMIPFVFFIIMIGFVVGPELVNENRKLWLPWWDPVISEIYDKDASEIVLLYEPHSFDTWPVKYPISGKHFQHSVQIVPIVEIIPKLKTENNLIIKPPDYIVLLCNPNVECQDRIDTLAESVSQYGYSIIKRTNHSVVLHV